MAEEITTPTTSETQTTATVAEENTTVSQEPQTTTQETTNENGTVENSNDGQVEETTQTDSTTQQPTVEELQAKIKEYEVRDEEDRKLRETLGIQDVDQQTFNLMNMDQQIVNVGKQEYIRLCNEYGIDANPSKIDA